MTEEQEVRAKALHSAALLVSQTWVNPSSGDVLNIADKFADYINGYGGHNE